KARQLLTSQKGLEHRRQRAIEPEAVFGQVKSNNKFNRFTMRGLKKAGLEFGLMALAHNLRKLVVRKNADKNIASKSKLTRQKTTLIIVITPIQVRYSMAA